MDIPLDEVIYVEAISSGATGVAVDADSTPTFAVYEEATDTDIGVGGNMTKRTSLTGNYRASFTASAANGFEAGKWYAVIGSATIGGIATKGVLKTFRIVLAEAVAGAPKTDVTYILGTLLTETSGQIAGAFKKFFNVSAPTATCLSLPDALPTDVGGSRDVYRIGGTVQTAADVGGIVSSATYGNSALNSDIDAIAAAVAALNDFDPAADTVARVTLVDSVTALASGAINRAAFAAETGLQTLRSNTAQGGTSSSIILDASASASDDIYRGCLIYLTGGTGAGQRALCIQYNGTTKVASVEPIWQVTSPSTDTTFAILPQGIVNVEAWANSATPVQNVTLVYDDDFLINYDQPSQLWQVNVKEISHNSTSADNLELQYNGTGLSGNTFPATQLQASDILTDTGTTLPASLASLDSDVATLQSSVSGLWTTALTEAYRADGAAPTPAQALCELLAHMGEVGISGTSKTTYKFDGVTQAAVYTLDSSTTPTTITRSA
jgi:hypothetical protein